jgi:DNA-binding MarR family transcriptional regulator
MQLLQKATVRVDPAEKCAADVLDAVPRIMQFIRASAPKRPEGRLSVQQFRTLGFLRAYPGASLSQVATYFGLTLPATSRLVAGLVQRRLVDRTPMPHNRRQLRLTIRPAGEKLLRSAIQSTRESIRGQLSPLPPKRLRAISRAVRELAEQLITDD